MAKTIISWSVGNNVYICNKQLDNLQRTFDSWIQTATWSLLSWRLWTFWWISIYFILNICNGMVWWKIWLFWPNLFTTSDFATCFLQLKSAEVQTNHSKVLSASYDLISFLQYSRFCFLCPPCVANAVVMLLSCFVLLSSFFLHVSSPNLSDRRLDVYHTSAHGVALVRI